jgi:hypothetical protein
MTAGQLKRLRLVVAAPAVVRRDWGDRGENNNCKKSETDEGLCAKDFID